MLDFLGTLIPFAPFALALCLTPGPPVVMVVATVANFGFRRTLPRSAGTSRSNGGAAQRERPINFVEALLFQWINPKG